MEENKLRLLKDHVITRCRKPLDPALDSAGPIRCGVDDGSHG